MADRKRFVELTYNIETFAKQLKEASKNLTVEQKQNILRMIVKEIIVGENQIKIKHSIPMDIEKKTNFLKSYLLGKGSH